MEQSRELKDYINKVCEQIRCKRAHKMIEDEITNHIEDQKKAFIKDGQDEKTALSNAIMEMGDAVTVGQQLDRIHRPKPEKSIIAIVAIMLMLQFTFASLTHPNGGFMILPSNIIAIMLGIAVMIGVYFLDYTILVRHASQIFVGFVISGILININPYYSSFFMDRSDFYIYYLSLIYIAMYSALIYKYRLNGYAGIFICCVYYLVGMLPILLSGSFMALFVYTFGCVLVLSISVVKGWFNVNKTVVIGMILILMTAFLFVFFKTNSYRMDRLIAVFKPEAYSNSMGWQVLIVREIINGSRLIGAAVMPERFAEYSIDYLLPDAYASHQLTYLIGSYGYIVGIIATLLSVILIVKMVTATLRQKNYLGMIVSLSCTVVIAIQSILYLLANWGICILTFSDLPLLSNGKIGLVVNMFIVGLLLSAYRNDDLVRDTSIAKLTSCKLFEYDNGRLIINFKE